jgi:DNA gyrase subunit A
MVAIKDFSPDKYFIMVTKKGVIKKTPETAFSNIRKNGLIAIGLREDDELIEVKTTDNTRTIYMVTKKGMCLAFKDTDIRSMGRGAMGVRGMRLRGGDEVVGMQLSTQGKTLLVVTENGMGKRTANDSFSIHNRGGLGIKCYKITDKTGDIVGVKAVNDDHEIMLITNQGIIIRLKCDDISTMGRAASGVRLMKIDKDSDIKVAGIAKVRELLPEELEAIKREEESLTEEKPAEQ